MTLIKTAIFSTLMLFLHLTVAGQVNPPEFLCVKADTLFWNPASNSCGSFLATEIYVSGDPAGPFTLLSRITDPAVTSFEHRAMGQQYYYLLADFDCPGQTQIPSDTLDNRVPVETVLESVSVEGSAIRIRWYPNPDPETIGYVIYRSTDRGTTPIDTVYNALEYVDNQADPDTAPEVYNVVALDACGNQGSFDVSHQTIHLGVTENFCEQYIQLNWSNYMGWPNGVENNQIWLGVNTDSTSFEHQIAGDDTLAYLLGINDGTEYCIQIVAKELGRDVIARSNTVCVVADVLQPLEALRILNVSVDRNDQVLIDWIYSANADVDTLTLTRTADTSGTSLAINNVTPPGQDSIQIVDESADVRSRPWFYQFTAIDACDNRLQSNIMSTIHLDVRSLAGAENDLTWSPMFLPGRILSEYQVCKVSNGVETLLTTLDADQFAFTDIIEPTIGSDEACYLIKGIHTNTLGTDRRVSTSNFECVEQVVEMYVPNAFVPTGENQIFKPEFVFLPANQDSRSGLS